MGQGDSLSADELDDIRTWSEEWMPDTCYVLRNSGTLNSMGGRERAWGTAGTVLCRLRPAMGQGGIEAERQGAVVADSEWEIVLPYDTDATVEDRLRVSGVVYEPIAPADGHSSMPDKRFRCVRRD